MTIFNVKDFGAVGNGSTPDDKAIQEAINHASISGGAVYFPTGVYLITDTLQCEDSSQVRIFGYGTDHYKANPKSSAMLTIQKDWPHEYELQLIPSDTDNLPDEGEALVAVKQHVDGFYDIRIFDRIGNMNVDKVKCGVEEKDCKLSTELVELLDKAFNNSSFDRSELLRKLPPEVGYHAPQDKPIFRVTGSDWNRAGGMIFEGFSILGRTDVSRERRGIGFHVTKRNSGSGSRFWGCLDWRDVYCRSLNVGIYIEDPVNTGNENGFGWLHVNRCRLEDCYWGIMTWCTVNDLTLRDSIIRHSIAEPTGSLSSNPESGGGALLRYGSQLVIDGCDFEGQRSGVYSGMRHATISNNYFESMKDVSISIQGAEQVDIRSNLVRDDGEPGTGFCYINNCDRVNYENNQGKLVIGSFCRNITIDRPVVFLPVVIDTNSGAMPPPHQISEIRNSGYYISEPFFSNTLINQVDPNNEQYPQNSDDPSFTLKLTNGAMYDRDDNNEIRQFIGPFGLPFWKVTATTPNAGVILERKWSDLVVGEWLGIRLWMRFTETDANATLLHFQRIIEFQDNSEPSLEHQGTLDTSLIALEDLMGKWYTLTWVHQVEENESRLHIVAQFGIPLKETNGSFDSRSMDITGFQSFRTLHPFVIPDSLEFGD